MKIKVQRPNGTTEIIDSSVTAVAILYTAREREHFAKVAAAGDILLSVPPQLWQLRGASYWHVWGDEGWGDEPAPAPGLELPNLIDGGIAIPIK